MIKKKTKEESAWIREIAYIMRAHSGPFTKLQIAAELAFLQPGRLNGSLPAQAHMGAILSGIFTLSITHFSLHHNLAKSPGKIKIPAVSSRDHSFPERNESKRTSQRKIRSE
jgi:hypothetical protein